MPVSASRAVTAPKRGKRVLWEILTPPLRTLQAEPLDGGDQ
ncbi:hypothetical protein N9D23_10720 [Rubripirellula sp.]|nr:hypothetical protein [Rubripirellula sp.]